ncbi:MAG: low molecular weight protein-tyrosine-phosphatase [Stenotrophomonas sp.]
MKLLVVCLGNICRSPMGEGTLRTRIAEAGLDSWVQVDSAGTSGHWHAGRSPDPRAVACARQHGVDISAQRARQLLTEDFEWEGIDGADVVPDPYYGDMADFEHSWALLDTAAQATVRRLSRRDDSGIIPA